MTPAPKNSLCSLLAKLIPIAISVVLSVLLSTGAAYANTAIATAPSSDNQAVEDLIVLNQLSKSNQNNQNQDSQNQIQNQNSQSATPSNAPEIASNKLILNSPVIDEARILTQSEKAHLEDQLRKIHNDNLAQMAVVIVPTTGNVDIFDYAITTANRWGLGKKDADNGILMLVAINDRKIFTVTGYGVEGVLPDAFLSRITRTDITPAFKSGQYALGLSAGIARIEERLRADPATLANATPVQPTTSVGIMPFFMIIPFLVNFIIMLFVFLFFKNILKMFFGTRRKGVYVSSGGFSGGSYRSSSSRSNSFGSSSFGSSSSSGSSGFSGGGGSFGGGGAGGSW